jgi:ethanolamine utilization protein EutA
MSDHHHDHHHDHEWDASAFQEYEPLEGIDQITLRSAGLDVGSSTTHLTLSSLVLRRRGAELSAQLVVAERTELYRSPIALTPYRADTLIDADALEVFLDSAYADAGFTPADIDTGVVIVTGEAANRANAQQLAGRFAERSGAFICVSAGPHYEALLAAHGSGAADLSRARGSTVLNIDIGGGTTKLSVVTQGEVTATAAFSVGARLVAFDARERLTRVEPPARWMLDELGAPAGVGDELPPELQERLAGRMADLLFEVLLPGKRSLLLDRLWVTEPLPAEAVAGVDTVVLSGGVSEYVFGREKSDFGDLGRLMGGRIRARLGREGLLGRTESLGQGIRATVLGAGQHSIQASGVTSFLDDQDVLPATALKVVAATVDTPKGLAAELQGAAARFEVDGRMPALVYALAVESRVDYAFLRGLAEQLREAARDDVPLFVVLDVDVAHALGRILRNELGWRTPLVVLDGLTVGELDYLDIGRPLGPGLTVPVTVKSLTFLTR